MWLSIDFGSIKKFGATILVVLMIFGLKSGGPPFFHDELDASLLGHVLDFQFWPAGPASPSPPPKPEKFRKFDEKIMIFVAKLRESTGNRSPMVSGGVADVCDELSRVFALSGGEKPSEFTKSKHLRADSLLCLS